MIIKKKQFYYIAQSGANIGLRKLKDNPLYRSYSFSDSAMMGGKVNIRVIDTIINAVSVVAVKSTGHTNYYGITDTIKYTSIAIPPNNVSSTLKVHIILLPE